MIENDPLASAVAVPREVSPLNSSTALPTSAVPSIVGVVSLVAVVVDVITGASGAVVSISIVISEDAADSFPAASVALTVKLWLPSLNSKNETTTKLPSASAVAVPRDSSPLNSSTVLPASAVPAISGVGSFVHAVVVDIPGASGSAVSIVNASAVEADEVLPDKSVALTMRL